MCAKGWCEACWQTSRRKLAVKLEMQEIKEKGRSKLQEKKKTRNKREIREIKGISGASPTPRPHRKWHREAGFWLGPRADGVFCLGLTKTFV